MVESVLVIRAHISSFAFVRKNQHISQISMMNSRSSLSLNTSPVEESEGGGIGGGGGSPADAIDESFWQVHLWPNPTIIEEHAQPPPEIIFGGGGSVSVDVAGGGADSFVFPVLGGGSGGGVPIVHVDNRNAGKKRGSENQDVVIISGTDHVSGERERRKRMRSMFSALQSLLPHLSEKVDKSTIVNEAITLIKTLETTLQNLKQKKDNLRRNPTTATTTYEPPPSSTTSPQLKLAGQTTRESFLAEYGSGPTLKPLAHRTVENGPSHQNGGVMFQTWTSSNVVLNTFGKNEALIMACSKKKPGLLTAIVAVLVKHMVEVENIHAFANEDQCSYMIHARLANGASEQHPNSSAEQVFKQAVGELMHLVVVDNNNAVIGGA